MLDTTGSTSDTMSDGMVKMTGLNATFATNFEPPSPHVAPGLARARHIAQGSRVSAAPQILDPQHPPARLALAYARASDRPLWASYFALEARLAEAGARTSQPMMAQLRLAWWRDRLKAPAPDWPKGEPLLAALICWDAERAALAALVDGWEAVLVGEDGGDALAEARVSAMLALARLCGMAAGPEIERAARDWQAPASASAVAAKTLPRPMRPLAVLRMLAMREAERRDGVAAPLGDAVALLRLALTGR